MLELNHSSQLHSFSLVPDGTRSAPMAPDVMPSLPGLSIDEEFSPVEIPRVVENVFEEGGEFDPFDLSAGQAISDDHTQSTYIVRAKVAANKLSALEKSAGTDGRIRAVYSDPEIEACDQASPSPTADPATSVPRICPGSPPLGSDRHVAARLGVPWLRRRGMNGTGVYVAIVDSGINLAHLRARGLTAQLDVARSWMAHAGDQPGQLPVGHGTMCAYDALIAAPRATLLDIALLRSTRPGGSAMAGLLSDAVRAYVHLFRLMRGPRRPGEARSLVVNNSWGMFHPSWDFPVGHAGRYMDNPRHPFNIIVGVLAHAGADIVFAAGNCGRDCPDGRCRGVTNGGIYGANSHSQVLSVAGVDLLKRRVGYSNSGPGNLMHLKPDICGYTHFRGSGVYPADGGTSAAAPVVAGLVAALRSRFPYDPNDYRTSPAAMRNLITRTAEDRGAIGFDYHYGWGIANGRRMALLRSMSVLSSADEPAADINEFSAAERALESIDGLDEVPRRWHEETVGAPVDQTKRSEPISASEPIEVRPPDTIRAPTSAMGDSTLPPPEDKRTRRARTKSGDSMPA
ncbi:MAG: serine protease [Myxococcales bacterium FL481]|nr:MAG: serine protease [Myxococcales bacterium FL481]